VNPTRRSKFEEMAITTYHAGLCNKVLFFTAPREIRNLNPVPAENTLVLHLVWCAVWWW